MVPVGIPVSSDERRPRDHLEGLDKLSVDWGGRRRPANLGGADDLPGNRGDALSSGKRTLSSKTGLSVGSSLREVKKATILGEAPDQAVSVGGAPAGPVTGFGAAGYVVQK